MTNEDRELLRIKLLLQCDAGSRLGLPVSRLQLGAKAAGFDLDIKEIEHEVEYLVDKGLIDLTGKTISPENRRYRITAEGRDFLATQNY